MPNAILSVYDKTGLIEFAQALSELKWNLIASGGTAKLLRENQLPVTDVSNFTGFSEVLNGRVKTLHPAIHAGILARPIQTDQDDLKDLGLENIDLVVVNLYPFEETVAKPNVSFEEAIENIDIGGVALIRAAAKNHQRVTLLCDPADYPLALEGFRSEEISAEYRRQLALKGFAKTAHYDNAITSYLLELDASDNESSEEQAFDLKLFPVSSLRYGENSHQSAKLYAYEPGKGPLGGTLLQGKALSYNNLLDLDAAWRGAVTFERPTVCIVKHLSPCGLASGESLASAFPLALASDPVSAFGSVIATNRVFDAEIAQSLGKLFVECIIAPGFKKDALDLLSKRKNLRLVSMPNTQVAPPFELRSINQGILQQAIDCGDPDGTNWEVVSNRQPSEEEWMGLRFAWKACQHVKSNAIVFVKGETTVGIGGGQPNRVDCVRIATQRAGEKARGAVMASDAFFPFPDSVEEAAKVGITAIIAPGGSKRDSESIAAADANQIALVFTGIRHFRH